MKTTIYLKYLPVALFLLFLSACAEKGAKEQIISVTIEPQRYFAEKIAGDRFRIHCVVPSGQSPETYDPTPREMVEIGESTAYFQIGHIGFEQAWLGTIRENNPSLKFFDLSEGMQMIQNEGEAEETHDHDHDHDHEQAEDHGHHHHPGGIDPHTWSSIAGARVIARNTLNAFLTLDPENKALYQVNYEKLLAEIDETEKTIQELLRPIAGQAFIIYHPALTYFAVENNLVQLCIEADGKEPSPGQLKALVKQAKEANAHVVFIQQEFDQKNAELIAREAGCKRVQINPLAYDWKAEMIHTAKSLAANGEAD